jgi:hypothetical protein
MSVKSTAIFFWYRSRITRSSSSCSLRIFVIDEPSSLALTSGGVSTLSQGRLVSTSAALVGAKGGFCGSFGIGPQSSVIASYPGSSATVLRASAAGQARCLTGRPRRADLAATPPGGIRPRPFGGHLLEAHGGYLCRIESFGEVDVAALAREALTADGLSSRGARLRLSTIPRRKIVRLAYEAPFCQGASGAAWYGDHHALAQLLSVRLGVVMHAYAVDPERFEQVVTYGNGRKVGGESLAYADVELDEDDDEEAFAKLASRWPLGHLAYVYGVPRELLLRLPRAEGLSFGLDEKGPALEELWTKGSPLNAA